MRWVGGAPYRAVVAAVVLAVVAVGGCGGASQHVGADTTSSAAALTSPGPTDSIASDTVSASTDTATTGTATGGCQGLQYPLCPLPAPKDFGSVWAAALAQAVSLGPNHAIFIDGVTSDPDGNGNQWELKYVEYLSASGDRGCLTDEPGDTVVKSDDVTSIRTDSQAHVCRVGYGGPNEPDELRLVWHEMGWVFFVDLQSIDGVSGVLSPPYTAADLISAVDHWQTTGVQPDPNL